MSAEDEPHCSFCGKAQSQVAHIVCGPTRDIAICNECVALSTEIMREGSGDSPDAPDDQASPSQ